MAERTILEFADRVLPGQFSGESWASWRVVLKGLFALPMDAGELAVFHELTGRETAPTVPGRELWAIVGRRGGKSIVAALVAVYLTTCRIYRLAPGERGVFMVIAADRQQARVVRRYVSGLLASTPVLAQLVENETKTEIQLANRLSIEIHTASYRTVRGYTVVGAVADEIAFWPVEDAAEPDAEILAALRPAMATVPGAVLLCLSSPYAARGELHKAFSRHYGQDGDVLVVRAPTRVLNPLVPASEVERALAEDPASAASEYLAEWRLDVAALLAEDAIQAVLPPGVRELAPDPKAAPFAHFDASTGAGSDAAALAIAFAGGEGHARLAALRRWKPPFSPAGVVREASELLRSYGLARVQIDRYAPGLIQELFREHGVEAKVSDLDTSGAFVELLGLINSARVTLLDDPVLLGELRRLERSARSGGRDRVAHPPGAHDDLAAAAGGALVAATRKPVTITELVWGSAGGLCHGAPREDRPARAGVPAVRVDGRMSRFVTSRDVDAFCAGLADDDPLRNLSEPELYQRTAAWMRSTYRMETTTVRRV